MKKEQLICKPNEVVTLGILIPPQDIYVTAYRYVRASPTTEPTWVGGAHPVNL
jgi:hypothetical protein